MCISATSVDVEHVFSRGRLLLSHVQTHLSAQSTRALLCLGCWSLLGLVKDSDVMPVARLPDLEGEEGDLEDGWTFAEFVPSPRLFSAFCVRSCYIYVRPFHLSS